MGWLLDYSFRVKFAIEIILVLDGCCVTPKNQKRRSLLVSFWAGCKNPAFFVYKMEIDWMCCLFWKWGKTILLNRTESGRFDKIRLVGKCQIVAKVVGWRFFKIQAETDWRTEKK